MAHVILGIIADKLSAAGWSWGYCSAVTRTAGVGSLMPHRKRRQRYIVHSDELLSAFLEPGAERGYSQREILAPGADQTH